MIEIGKSNNLKVTKKVEFGVFLDGQDLGDILLPTRSMLSAIEVGDTLKVFLYLDSEDRLIASAKMPMAMVGDFALLEVVSVSSAGAFLDWGLPKDLLVPFREQKRPLETGKKYLVYIYVDETSQRIVATTKIERYLTDQCDELQRGDKVDLLIANKTDLGYTAIVNNKYLGVIYHSEIFKPLFVGNSHTGYVLKIREDQKLDLTLLPIGYEKVEEGAQQILDYLHKKGGFIELNDNSPAELINYYLGMSKKTFKKGVGSLYKQKLITIEENGIKLVIKPSQD